MPVFRVARLMTDALRLQIGTPVGGCVQGGKTYDGCVVTSTWNASWCSCKTYDGCVVTSNWNASWCSVQGGKTYDGCVVTSNWERQLVLLFRVARLMTDAL